MDVLTNNEKLTNKQKYFNLLCNLNIDLLSFAQYLDSARVDFYNKPYGNYDGWNYSGALCYHSLCLYKELKKLCDLYFPNKYEDTSIIKIALLKDIYRAELYEFYDKNIKDDSGKWVTIKAIRVKEQRPIFGEIGFSSYMIARKFFDFSDDELVEAMCFSNVTNIIDLAEIRKDYPLVTLTAMAELAVNYLSKDVFVEA